MAKKRYRKVLGLIEDSNGDLLDLTEIQNEMNQLNDENEQLKQEKEELLDKILECQKALSRRKIREEPHWHKYGKNEGYTAKIDLDIRFDGDV